MSEIDEIRAVVAEQEELIKDKADAGHVGAKYWGMLVTERRRVEQLRRDVESWQEMYRQASAAARALGEHADKAEQADGDQS